MGMVKKYVSCWLLAVAWIIRILGTLNFKPHLDGMSILELPSPVYLIIQIDLDSIRIWWWVCRLSKPACCYIDLWHYSVWHSALNQMTFTWLVQCVWAWLSDFLWQTARLYFTRSLRCYLQICWVSPHAWSFIQARAITQRFQAIQT